MNKKFIVQKVRCHKHRTGKCDRTNPPDPIMFDEQGFPWCAWHFPKDRKANLPDLDIKKWIKEAKKVSKK